MAGRKRKWRLGVILAILLAFAGCAGILQETTYDDGQVQRLRIQGGESWKTWDRNATKEDESGFILKKETTF